jgi:hypothetical protein
MFSQKRPFLQKIRKTIKTCLVHIPTLCGYGQFLLINGLLPSTKKKTGTLQQFWRINFFFNYLESRESYIKVCIIFICKFATELCFRPDKYLARCTETTLCGLLLSPGHGASSSFGWWKRPPSMNKICILSFLHLYFRLKCKLLSSH